MLLAAGGAAILAAVAEFALGSRHPLVLAITCSLFSPRPWLPAAGVLDARRRAYDPRWLALVRTLQSNRRQYAGFLIHLGFACLAVGVTGSALGKRECEVDMQKTRPSNGQGVRSISPAWWSTIFQTNLWSKPASMSRATADRRSPCSPREMVPAPEAVDQPSGYPLDLVGRFLCDPPWRRRRGQDPSHAHRKPADPLDVAERLCDGHRRTHRTQSPREQ